MKMSSRGLAELAGHEGIVTSPYKDCAGVWTVGVGHTAAAGPPDPKALVSALSVEAALDLFRHDVARYEAEVDAAVTVPLSQHEFDALVSFHYNTGAIRYAGLTRALNRGDRLRAAEGFLAWRKPAEILPRRRLERKLFLEGVYGHGGVANVYTATRGGAVQWARGRCVDVAALLSAMAA
ncbi:lysozyme [Aureimonas altamirensis]|uniref:lysozyme n=1 Tax=Aureimonas altamirensis TaxID=370622 RepID=UPI001E3713B6|nr:lysozyme [Aureimonas altamirensis]UHD44858.1 lysozyme [Aureimonas altamirensis]